MADSLNWNLERQKLKDEIMKELREQRDKRSKLTTEGTVRFSPQTVASKGTRGLLGLYKFGTSFKSRPSIGFSNVLSNQDVFYIVQPYIAGWEITQGLVDGFYLGVYALTDAPLGLDTHIIGWVASGKASFYRPNPSSDRWTYSYDLSKSTHLQDDAN